MHQIHRKALSFGLLVLATSGSRWNRKIFSKFNMIEGDRNMNSIIKLRIEQIDEVATLIDAAFPLSSTHSWSRALGFQEGHLFPYLKNILLPKCISDSHGELDSLTNTLNGVIILEICKFSEADQEVKTFQESLQDNQYSPEAALQAILNQCTTIFLGEWRKRFEINYDASYTYVAWIVTRETCRGRGTAGNLLNFATKQQADETNSTAAVAYCSHPGSQRVFERQGYETWGVIYYDKFKYKDQTPFSVLPDYVAVMVKLLRVT